MPLRLGALYLQGLCSVYRGRVVYPSILSNLRDGGGLYMRASPIGCSPVELQSFSSPCNWTFKHYEWLSFPSPPSWSSMDLHLMWPHSVQLPRRPLRLWQATCAHMPTKPETLQSCGRYLSSLNVHTDFDDPNSWEWNMDELVLKEVIWQDKH